MLNYDFFYLLHNERDQERLIEELMPMVARWAKDVLRHTAQARNHSFHEDMIDIGTQVLVETVNKRLNDDRIQSGQHLVNSCRKAVRGAMRRALGKSLTDAASIESSIDAACIVDRFDQDQTRQRLADMVSRAVREAAKGGEIKLANAICSGDGLSISAAAKACGMTRGAARACLRRLRERIVRSATPEMREAGRELQVETWSLPA